MESILRVAIQRALGELFGITEASFSVEQPKDITHGDYATNVAFVLAKQSDKSPKDIIDALLPKLQDIEHVAAVSTAGTGFINFTLKPEYFADTVSRVLEQKGEWGKSDIYAGKKILVEHSSPNLFKPFHIGHLMNNTIGESITRLAKASGANVAAMSFPSDISLGIAKAIFILLEKGTTDFSITNLGEAYVEGTKRYDEDESIHVRVKEIADNLYAKNDSEEWKAFQVCRDFNIEYFEHITQKLGSHFDAYIYESEAGVDGKKIVLENTPRVFTESEGAIVYIPDEDRKDINTAVFINSHGNPTYEAKDIGLIDMKFKRFSPDTSIFITDNNQIPHFDVVLAAAEEINDEWKARVAKSVHVAHGRMSFMGQKMSSRLGSVPLVEAILKAVMDEVRTKNPNITESDAEAIGIAALKFSILRAQAGKSIDFDLESSLSFKGDSGPYLQYSAVRARSVLENAARQGIPIDLVVRKDPTTTELERVLIHYPEVVERSIQEWAPHHIVTFLLELAQAFNSYYGQVKIIDEDKAASAYRLGIVQAIRTTLTNGLHLLGIEVPKKM
ncbi:MAG TPA: arginine--tRNA ligase [Candidatus Paceibacterota bacterium]|nr:arginine--tRNA ligase [Candidatus Paceibacterota bacterium]